MMGSYFALSDKSYPLPPLLADLADAISKNSERGPLVIRDAIGLAYAMGKSDGKLELANSQLAQFAQLARLEKPL